MKYIFYVFTLLAEVVFIAILTSMNLSSEFIILIIFSIILILVNLFVNISYVHETSVNAFHLIYNGLVAYFEYDIRIKAYIGRVLNLEDLQGYIMTADSKDGANKAFLEVLDKEGLLENFDNSDKNS